MQIYRVISFLVLVFHIFLAMPHCMWDLSSLTRDRVPLHWKLSLNYWINTEVPTNFIFIQIKYANTNTYILVNVHAIYKFMQNELE